GLSTTLARDRTPQSADLHCRHLLRFFFQAEDGIRDFHVTGVQTCALPISRKPAARAAGNPSARQARRYGYSFARAMQWRGRESEIGRASCRERVEMSVVAVVL